MSVEEVGLREELVAAAELGLPQEPGLVGELVAAPEELDLVEGLVAAPEEHGLVGEVVVALEELDLVEEVVAAPEEAGLVDAGVMDGLVAAQIQKLRGFGAQLAGD